MAQIVGEFKDKLTPIERGENVTELKFRGSFNGEDMHYPHDMISGCKMMERCIDCCTELSNIRDNGDGGLFVKTTGNITHPMFMLDAYEIYTWLIKQGNTSRVYGYEMWKTSGYNKGTDLSEVYNEPILAVKGEVVFVVGTNK